MPKVIELDNYIQKEMEKRDYRPRTIDSYIYWIRKFFQYYPELQVNEVSEKHFQEYVDMLENRKKLAAFTIHQAVNAFHLIFNEFMNLGIPIKTVKRPPRKRETPDVLFEDEVKAIFESVKSPHTKLALMLLYSIGMELNEAMALRPSDIDLRNKTISVRLGRGKKRRIALIANSLIGPITQQLAQRSSKEWVFPGRKLGQHSTGSSIQKAIKTAAKRVNLKKQVSVKSLRYAYVKHLQNRGISLNKILSELQISSPQSIVFYNQLQTSEEDILVTPLDFIFQGTTGSINVEPLRDALSMLKDKDIIDYLSESILCLEVLANRAAVIFTWSASIRAIQSLCLTHSPNTLNSAIQKFIPKSKKIKTINDFSTIRDRTTLDVSMELGVFDKNEHGVLVECLNLRNRCGHPGKYSPGSGRVTAFIEDIITIVFRKI